MYRDHEFDPAPAAEPLDRESEYARRVRREVRRVEGDGTDAAAAPGEPDGEPDDEEREAVRAAEEARRRKEERRSRSIVRQLFSGTILVREGVSRYYSNMACIAGMFFVNIVVMFWSLYVDRSYSRLESEVQALRERSVRLEEQRYRRTTHSAVAEELRRRGIELYDPPEPGEIIGN